MMGQCFWAFPPALRERRPGGRFRLHRCPLVGRLLSTSAVVHAGIVTVMMTCANGSGNAAQRKHSEGAALVLVLV